jgi:hypothetical protein
MGSKKQRYVTPAAGGPWRMWVESDPDAPVVAPAFAA